MNQRSNYKPKNKPKPDQVQTIKLDFSEHAIEADIDRMKHLWIGLKKIGKTVNANRAGAYFLKCEAGHGHIKHRGMVVKNWPHFAALTQEIVRLENAGHFPHNKVCVDTLGECWKMCANYILHKYNIMHESDLEQGKGYSLVENAFRQSIMPLSQCGLGIIFCAHTEDKELKDDNGNKYKKAVAMIPKGCDRVVGGMVDLLLYFTVEWDDAAESMTRVIRTAPSKYHDGGVRYPDGWTRRLPVALPMQWEVLRNAWNAGRPDGEAVQQPEQPEQQPEPAPAQQQPPPAQQQPPPPKLPPNTVKADGRPAQQPQQEEPPPPTEPPPQHQQQERRTGTRLGK